MFQYMHSTALICKHDLIKMQSHVACELETVLHLNGSDADAALPGIMFIYVFIPFW